MTDMTNERTCPQCKRQVRVGDVSGTDLRCPECGAKIDLRSRDNSADVASADSFPASDPPGY